MIYSYPFFNGSHLKTIEYFVVRQPVHHGGFMLTIKLHAMKVRRGLISKELKLLAQV